MTVSNITIDTKDLFSYLCMYVEDDLVNVFMNLKEINEGYMKVFDHMQQMDYPERITLAPMDIEYKQIMSFITPFDKEALAKISMSVYDADGIKEKHPEIFED